MPCNSHFAQLVDIFNTYFEAFEKRIEDEARTLLGPVARLEDLDLGIFVVVPHSLAIVGHHVQIGLRIGRTGRHAQLNEEARMVARKQVEGVATLGLLELLRDARELEAERGSKVAGGIEEGVLVRVLGA